MKINQLRWILGLAIMLGAGSLHALGTFEGEVDYQMKSKDTEGTMAYLLKGKKMRMNMDMKGHTSSMIFDTTNRQVLILMPEQKMYMTQPIPEKKSDAKMEGTFSKTGKTLEILGHTCEEWLYQGKNTEVSTWCASGMGTFMGATLQKGQNMSAEAWVEAVKHKGLFPLKTEARDKDGKTVMTMEATKIEKKSVSASEFEPPANYKKFDMGNLFGGGVSKSSEKSGPSEKKDILSDMKPKLPF